MSEHHKIPDAIASNKKIIDELTKDLESSLMSEEDSEDFVINPGSSESDFFSSTTDTKIDEPEPYIPSFKTKDQDADEKETEEEHDSDSIDELSLKDAEVDLTDDQKAERKIIAEELKNSGNKAYKREDYSKSVKKYTEALRICPLQFTQNRAVLYCNRSAARMKQERYDKAIKDSTKTIELDEKYLKAYLRRAQSYEATDKLDEALADFKKALEIDPEQKESKEAVIRLPPLIEEKNEKLKTEMLGQLKNLGNMILKPFGLSTENFQLEQDPESKGYKINFKQ